MRKLNIDNKLIADDINEVVYRMTNNSCTGREISKTHSIGEIDGFQIQISCVSYKHGEDKLCKKAKGKTAVTEIKDTDRPIEIDWSGTDKKFAISRKDRSSYDVHFCHYVTKKYTDDTYGILFSENKKTLSYYSCKEWDLHERPVVETPSIDVYGASNVSSVKTAIKKHFENKYSIEAVKLMNMDNIATCVDSRRLTENFTRLLGNTLKTSKVESKPTLSGDMQILRAEFWIEEFKGSRLLVGLDDSLISADKSLTEFDERFGGK